MFIHQLIGGMAMIFKDNYEWTSGWIHDYFCDKDGAELIFDINNCNYFECPICHYKYTDEKRKRAWTTKYRYKIFDELEKYSKEKFNSKNYKDLIFINDALKYYSTNYEKFLIHDKNGTIYDSYIDNPNKCGKITAQGLNEAMISIQIANCISNLGDYLDENIKVLVYNLFEKIYHLLKSQINRIHNIDCYEVCAIGIMGIICQNREMINYAFNSNFSVYAQLEKGITKDNFWFEGSFHYHLFVLKPILELLKIAKQYNFVIPEKFYQIARQMLLQCYRCSFSDCSLPSPNDGWPNKQLYDYIEVYEIGNELFENEFCNIIQSIKDKKNKTNTCHFIDTGFSLFKNNYWNVFIKYKDNNTGHSHPDKLNVEIKIKDEFLTHDLSTSGYGSNISKDFYKRTYSHNTIVIGGRDQNLNCESIIKYYDDNILDVQVKNIYDGVDCSRKIELLNNKLNDYIKVNYSENQVIDYIFHCDAELVSKFNSIDLDKIEEYPYFKKIKEVITKADNISLTWKLNNQILNSVINLKDKKLFICISPDNPNIKNRVTLIIRNLSKKNVSFNIRWRLNYEEK